MGSLEEKMKVLVGERERMEEEKRAVEGAVKDLYKDIEKTKYRLFSIIIHEGTADHGHYYCFVRMQAKWFKFNDFHVREIPEQEVFAIAYGGFGTVAAATCVFYMKETMWNNAIDHNFSLLANSEGSSSHSYLRFIETSLLQNVKQANFEFEKALVAAKAKKISSIYIKKHQEVKRNIENSVSNNKKNAAKVKGLRSIFEYIIGNQLLNRKEYNQQSVKNELQIGRAHV